MAEKMRKVTVLLPEALVDSALRSTGEGLTPTIRLALQQLNHQNACRRLLELRGTWKPSIDFNALRDLDD